MDIEQILKGFMRIQRRSEKASPEILRKTFVDVGPLLGLLSITDNQALFGRRGTGKTHVLQYLASKRRDEGDLAVYIDLSNLGSSGSLYSDTNRSVPERATRLLVDTLLTLHNGLLESVLDNESLDLSRFGPLLDSFAQAATRVEVVGSVEQETNVAIEGSSSASTNASANLTEKGPSVGLGGTLTSQESEKLQVRRKSTGKETYVLHFGEIATALERVMHFGWKKGLYFVNTSRHYAWDGT